MCRKEVSRQNRRWKGKPCDRLKGVRVNFHCTVVSAYSRLRNKTRYPQIPSGVNSKSIAGTKGVSDSGVYLSPASHKDCLRPRTEVSPIYVIVSYRSSFTRRPCWFNCPCLGISRY